MNESTGAGPASQALLDAPGEHSGEGHRQHDAVRKLRERLAELGFPEDQVRQILPVTDMQRRPYVRMGTWTVASTEKLLDALTPAVEMAS